MTVRLRRGFTLVELLVVITIIGLLAALITSGILSARNAAQGARCVANMEEIGKAMAGYDSRKGHLPGVLNKRGATAVSWAIEIFQDLGRGDLADSWRTGAGTVAKVDQLICPLDTTAASNPAGLSYVVNVNIIQNRTVAGFDSSKEYAIANLKSATRTVVLSERPGTQALPTGPWNTQAINTTTGVPLGFVAPAQQAPPAVGPVITTFLPSIHGNVVSVLFADAHVERLPDDTACSLPQYTFKYP